MAHCCCWLGDRVCLVLGIPRVKSSQNGTRMRSKQVVQDLNICSKSAVRHEGTCRPSSLSDATRVDLITRPALAIFDGFAARLMTSSSLTLRLDTFKRFAF